MTKNKLNQPTDKSKINNLTQEELKSILHYNPKTGIFTRKISAGGRKVGSIAGRPNNIDYIRIGINGTDYLAHRLAFLYMTGSFPKDQVDHTNQKRSDNRFDNLSECSNQENGMNCQLSKNNTSGFNGVCFDVPRNKWQAQIMVDGKSKHLGRFQGFEEAVSARKKANIKYGFHKNHGGVNE